MTIKEILVSLAAKIPPPGASWTIQLTNIATVNDGDQFLEIKSPTILSIVNITEDHTLKYLNLVRLDEKKDGATPKRYKKTEHWLKLSILFSSYSKDPSNVEIYGEGLDKLESVIRYLRNNNVFYYDDTKLFDRTEIGIPPGDQLADKSLLKLEMESLNMEELNHMWSFLGGRYMPSVLYTVRLIPIQEKDTAPAERII
jgi:Pvc16 N-terminal domain